MLLHPSSACKAMLYGYGFSYMYTRSAWETVAFPDCEDHATSKHREVSITFFSLLLSKLPFICLSLFSVSLRQSSLPLFFVCLFSKQPAPNDSWSGNAQSVALPGG